MKTTQQARQEMIQRWLTPIKRMEAELAAAKAELKAIEADLDRLAHACMNLIDSHWEHRCSDNVGGCTAVSAVFLAALEVSLAECITLEGKNATDS